MEGELKEIYSQHLVLIISDCIQQLCYGCIHKREEKAVNNLCGLVLKDQVHYCIYYAIDLLDEGRVMEQYGNEMGQAALEWVDIFDYTYRRSQWMMTDHWLSDMTDCLHGKLISQ